jgi:hypothetical protein
MSEQNEVLQNVDLMNSNFDTIWMGAVVAYFQILILRIIGIVLPKYNGHTA